MNELVPDTLDDRVITGTPSGDAQIVRPHTPSPNFLLTGSASLGQCQLLLLSDYLYAAQEENWNLCLNSGKAIGCRVNGISIDDLIDGKPQALLRLIWEIIKARQCHLAHTPSSPPAVDH